jgi:hypothetical protein
VLDQVEVDNRPEVPRSLLAEDTPEEAAGSRREVPEDSRPRAGEDNRLGVAEDNRQGAEVDRHPWSAVSLPRMRDEYRPGRFDCPGAGSDS